MRVLFFFLFSVFSVLIQAQSLSLIDSLGNPVFNAQVKALNSKKYFLTNDEGKAQLGIQGKDQLVISCMGFETDTFPYVGESLTIELRQAQYGLNEFVITAQYQPTAASKSVHQVRTIDAGEIEKRAAINLQDVLRNELYFRTGQDNILGSEIQMQGISGENVKIMIDGVPVIGRLNGNIDLSQINLNNIERIEMVEGPLAVNYGSNALAGTINLITKSPKASNTQAGGRFYTESTGHYNFDFNAATGFKTQSIQISGGRNYFDGWNPGDSDFYHDRSRIANSSRVQQWKPREQYFADGKYRNAFKSGYFEVAGNYFDELIINRGAPRGAYRENAIDDEYQTLRYGLNGKLQLGLGEKWNTHHVLAYNYYSRTKSTYTTDLTTLQRSLTENPALLDTTQFNTYLARGSFIGEISSRFNLQLGYEVEIEEAAGKRIVDETGMIENYALFGTATYNITENFTVKPGLRWAYNSRYDAPLVPSINFLYNLKNIETRLSYAAGFRAPGLKELSFYFVDINHNIQGNPDLQAETSHNISASLKSRITKDNKLGWEISGYYNKIENLITLAQVTDVEFSYINIGQRETLGGRAEVERDLIQNLVLRLGFAYTGISNEIDHAEANKFAFTPEVSAGLQYQLPKTRTSIAAFYKYNGKRIQIFEVDDELEERTIEDFSNLDLTVSQKLWKNRLSLELGAKNLFDIQNIQSSIQGGAHSGGGSTPIGTGRSYFARLSFQISKQN